MAHINPALPSSGDKNWAVPLNDAISTIVALVNTHDDQIASSATPAQITSAVSAQASVDAGVYSKKPIALTQAQYDALPSPDPSTLYLIISA